MIENFLKDWKLQVVINNISSKPRDFISGVPHFYIVADIGSEIRLFADDVIMYSLIKIATDITQVGNNIKRLENWGER